jgi:hypothetical protein
MSRTSLLIILGILVVLTPFSGLPLSWLSWILPIIGLIVIVIGVSLHRRHRESAAANTSVS